MAWFKRTTPEAKAAQQAWQRGDRLFHVTLLYEANVDPNVAINRIAAVGWDLAFFTVAIENGQPWGVYLFKRVG
jgi:hypothetical protein